MNDCRSIKITFSLKRDATIRALNHYSNLRLCWQFVPLVVELCTKVIEERGIMNQGIYRVPGNKGAIHALELELNKNIDAIDLTNEKWQDVNAITSLLKMFFRNLPEPLITEGE